MEVHIQSPYGTTLGILQSVSNVRQITILDKAGRFDFEVALSDPQIDNVAPKNYVRFFDLVDGAWQEIGRPGLIESTALDISNGVLRVEGADVMRELTWRHVDDAEIYDPEWVTPAYVASHSSVGGNSEDMPDTYDDDTGTSDDIILDSSGCGGTYCFNLLYIGYGSVMEGVRFDFGTDTNSVVATYPIEYWDGTAWQDYSNVTDGTVVGGAPWAQDGDITFDRPTDIERFTHDGKNLYWVRFGPADPDEFDSVDIKEIDVRASGPAQADLQEILDYAPANWKLDSINGYDTTENVVYLQFRQETVLEALRKIGSHSGEHFRLNDNRITWTPASATTDGSASPHTWLRADGDLYTDTAGTTAVSTDGDSVGLWGNEGTDSFSGVTEATNKPTWQTNELNGRPVVRFDGTNDVLDGAFNTALSQPFTIFIVAALDEAAANNDSDITLVDGDDLTNRMALYQRSARDPDRWAMYAGGSVIDGRETTSRWNIWRALFDGGDSQFWIDGVTDGAGATGTDDPDGLMVGNTPTVSNYWDGDIAEILIYDSDLSAADRLEVENYLLAKYFHSVRWLQDDPSEDPTDCGFRALPAYGDNAGDGVALIEQLDEETDGYDQGSRIYPYGGGIGSSTVTLSNATESAPAGYTLDTTNNYIAHDTTDAALRIDKVRRWPDIVPREDTARDDELASNQLFNTALDWLQRNTSNRSFYDLDLVALDGTVEVGETIDVEYWAYNDDEEIVSIDTTLIITEVETSLEDNGVRTVKLQVSTVAEQRRTDALTVVEAMREYRDIRPYGTW